MYHSQHTSSSSHPFTTGEVGVLGEENAQRLCSAFSEMAYECLIALANMSSKHGTPSFLQLYRAGLACVPQWSHEVLKEEVSGLEARYSESELLYQYCYLSLMADLGEKGAGESDLQAIIQSMPPLSKFYHIFLNRVCASPDVMRGQFFFDQPYAARRAVFIECFRNALHDVVRQRDTAIASRPVLTGHRFATRDKGLSSLDCAEKQEACDSRANHPAENNRTGGDSVFKAALTIAANEQKENVAQHSEDEESAPAAHVESGGESSSSSSSLHEKVVDVSPSPCFFADCSPRSDEFDEGV